MSSGGSSSSMTTEEGDAENVNVILLPGFRFYPTDELLVSYYLRNKIQGADSHFRHLIPEIDVCKYEPCDLPAFFPEVHEKEWFFFSGLDYKYNNGTRCNRATDQGFYKITGKEREIRAEESKAVVGKKRTLTFYEGRVPKSKKTDWVVHEYYLTETEVGSKPTKQKDFVLCRLNNRSASYKKPKGGPIHGELADSGANSEDEQAVVSDVIAEPVEHLGNKELGDVNRNESPDASCLMDCNDIWTLADVVVETGGLKFSGFDDPNRFLELCAEMRDILNSPSQLPQPLQIPQPHQPLQPYQPLQPHQPPQPYQPLQPHQPQDYCPTTHYSHHSHISCLNQSNLCSPSINTELGDIVHTNNYIGCNDELHDNYIAMFGNGRENQQERMNRRMNTEILERESLEGEIGFVLTN